MKAILVIDDVPSCCTACPFFEFVNDYEDDCRIRCNVKFGRINEYGTEVRPKWCPLKPMPEPKEVEVNEIEDLMHTEYSIEDIYTNKYIATIRLATDKLISLGWNACLKEIGDDGEW